jgi:hypothetical protein
VEEKKMISRRLTRIGYFIILLFLIFWAIAELFPIVFLYMTAMKTVVSVIVCKKGGLEVGKATLPLVIKR